MKPIFLLLPLLLPTLGAHAPLPEPTPLLYHPFEARAGALPEVELTALLRSAREYEALVGRPPPPGIDFAREWVVFYGGGLQLSPHAQASIVGIELTEGGHALRVQTVLAVQAPGLVPVRGRCIPFAVATIARPRGEIHALRTEHSYVVLL